MVPKIEDLVGKTIGSVGKNPSGALMLWFTDGTLLAINGEVALGVPTTEDQKGPELIV